MNNVSDTQTREDEIVETPQEEQVALTDGDIYKIPVKQQLLLLCVILLLIFGTTITPHITALLQNKEVVPASLPNSESEDILLEEAETDTKPFSEVKLNAEAAYVFDVANQKELFSKNKDEVLPLASVTKLMTALVAQEVLDEDDSVPIGPLSIRQEGNSGLREGEVFNRLTLSDLVLMSSSNDGAFALAAAAGNIILPEAGTNAFVAAMNVQAEEIGLTNTVFRNPTGLDITDSTSGADGTAKDMAKLMEYIVTNEPDILAFTKQDSARMWSETGESHDAQDTNYYIDEIPGLLGSKTGFTYLAGGNLVVAFNVGLQRPIVAVVLGSTQQGRFTDMMKLVEETQTYIANEAE